VTGQALYLSVAGPGTALKALRACLAQPKLMFNLSFPDGRGTFWRHDQFKRDPEGYSSKTVPLGCGTHHMVLMTKREGFITSVTPEALWQELSSPRYTTPVLKAWTPWLHEKFQGLRSVLRDTQCFGCNPGVLSLADDTFDRVVSEGIKNGHIKF
jgi:hypothetical protein